MNYVGSILQHTIRIYKFCGVLFSFSFVGGVTIMREVIESFGFDAQSVAEAPTDSPEACEACAMIDGKFM
jgi:hypothetical protein